MIRAFKLYTGADNASHALEGTIDLKDRTDVVAIHQGDPGALVVRLAPRPGASIRDYALRDA
jgi:hypothetical protein